MTYYYCVFLYFQVEEELLPDLFWEPTAEVRSTRLKRHVVELDNQEEFESQK